MTREWLQLTLLRLGVIYYPLYACDDLAEGARARGIQYLDGDEVRLLGYAVRLGSSNTGNVRAMSILISRGFRVVRNKATTPSSATLELWMGNKYSRVDDVGVCPSAGALVVDVGASVWFLAGNPGKAPRRVALKRRDSRLYQGIGLDKGNLRKSASALTLGFSLYGSELTSSSPAILFIVSSEASMA